MVRIAYCVFRPVVTQYAIRNTNPASRAPVARGVFIGIDANTSAMNLTGEKVVEDPITPISQQQRAGKFA